MKKFFITLGLLIGLSLPAYANCVYASWYGPGFHGRTTANGETYNMNEFTAAHKTFRFGTRLRITHNGKSVIVRINDRGPYVGNRKLDLSRAAASEIGLIHRGVGRVCYEVI